VPDDRPDWDLWMKVWTFRGFTAPMGTKIARLYELNVNGKELRQRWENAETTFPVKKSTIQRGEKKMYQNLLLMPGYVQIRIYMIERANPTYQQSRHAQDV
jgi:hypothetical protein